MEWLKGIFARIEAFPEENVGNHDPAEPVGENKVIGTVPKDLRKLFAYRCDLINEYNALVEEHKRAHLESGHTPKTCQIFRDSSVPLKEEIEVLHTIFWRELKNELKIGMVSIGIKKGWQVVEIPNKEEEKEEPDPEIIHVVSVGSLSGFLIV